MHPTVSDKEEDARADGVKVSNLSPANAYTSTLTFLGHVSPLVAILGERYPDLDWHFVVYGKMELHIYLWILLPVR